MDRSKKVQAMRASSNKPAEKTDVIQTYIDHELMVLMSTIDAKIAMQSLMNDRGLLTERLMNLKSAVNKTEKLELEITQLEEDLEMRNTQIGDIRAKIMQTDLEAKMKQIPDNFTSPAELKIAMSYVLRALLDAREDFTTAKSKAEDLKVHYETAEERIEQLNDEMEKMKESHESAKSQMERDFETKLEFLCNMKGNESEEEEATNCDKYSKQNFVWMSKQLVKKATEVEDLKAKIFDLEDEVERVRKEKPGKKQKRRMETFNVADGDSSPEGLSDSEDEFDFNDSFHDPEWRKTPAGKRIKSRHTTTTLLKESVTNRMDGTGMLANISETSDASTSKRTSNGQVKCSCKGSCATKLCGCKKNGNFCSDTCKCSQACVNLPDESKESDGAAGGGAVEKENEEVEEIEESPKRAK